MFRVLDGLDASAALAVAHKDFRLWCPGAHGRRCTADKRFDASLLDGGRRVRTLPESRRLAASHGRRSEAERREILEALRVGRPRVLAVGRRRPALERDAVR